LLCEEEARVSLQLRYEMILLRDQPAGAAVEGQSRETVRSSRLRQREIMARLERHKALAH